MVKKVIGKAIAHAVICLRECIRLARPAPLCLIILLTFSNAHAAGVCVAPQPGTAGAPLLSPPLGKVVVGEGRTPFYSAPNAHCLLSGVFVVPKDNLIAYAETETGWTSVMYTNPKTGNVAEGWVRSSRLKTTGTMGPAR